MTIESNETPMTPELFSRKYAREFLNTQLEKYSMQQTHDNNKVLNTNNEAEDTLDNGNQEEDNEKVIAEFMGLKSNSNSNINLNDSGEQESPLVGYWIAIEQSLNLLNEKYTEDLQQLLNNLETLDVCPDIYTRQRRNLWIEAAYKADTTKANHRLSEIQKWSHSCERYVSKYRRDLESCICVIKETVDKLQPNKQEIQY